MLIAALGKGGGGNAPPGEAGAQAGEVPVRPARAGSSRWAPPRASPSTDPSLPAGRLEVQPLRRERRADPQPAGAAGDGRQDQQDRRPPRQERRHRRGALRRSSARGRDRLRGGPGMARHAPRHRAVPDARERRRARRDPRAWPHLRPVGDDDRLRRPRHRADARGQPAVPRDVPAREPLRQDVRSGAGRHRDPAAQGVRERRGAGERPQDRRAPEPRNGGPRRLHPPARHPRARPPRTPARKWCSVSCSPTMARRARSPSRCRTG